MFLRRTSDITAIMHVHSLLVTPSPLLAALSSHASTHFQQPSKFHHAVAQKKRRDFCCSRTAASAFCLKARSYEDAGQIALPTLGSSSPIAVGRNPFLASTDTRDFSFPTNSTQAP
ncbi:hypothetical protein BJ508DRAFT_111382 [Ascobolus immersus RN42]|uniref:Uncharacterized protein n=1 Tax=Ascobolus immersus RN42 TaxID=1160509 RepID=A0A3N4I810_ASCIM|nr:hypothetical protein BJ508DRAFT_111382 [Ascobolus immersus RN42]